MTLVGAADAARAARFGRVDFRHFLAIPTRWMDNDFYGHVNNVTYYSYFDTVVNDWLIRQGLLDVEKGAVIGLVVETGCHYFESLTYPETVTAAMRVAHVGNSSVRYEIALFGEGREQAAAQGEAARRGQGGVGLRASHGSCPGKRPGAPRRCRQSAPGVRVR